MSYLHNKGIVHQNLSTRNIFLCKEVAIVCDVGLASLSEIMSRYVCTLMLIHTHICTHVHTHTLLCSVVDVYCSTLLVMKLNVADKRSRSSEEGSTI